MQDEHYSSQGCVTCHQSLLQKFPKETEELASFITQQTANIDPRRRRGTLIACLHQAQSLFGYIPLEVQEFIARKLKIQASAVHGVISFYSYFTDKPMGKYKINVCTGTACFVRGADRVFAEFSEQLGLTEGQTSEDGLFSLTSIRCVGACSLAPVVMVNDKVIGNVTQAMVESIISDCRKEV
jgi:NADH:ubiquinone oxidoreductase subunit E